MKTLKSKPATKTTAVNLLTGGARLRSAWDEFVHKHPKGSIYHTSQMVRVFSATKYHRVLPLAAINRSGKIVALLVAVRVQTLPNPLGPLSSRSIWYAEPLCHDDPRSIDALAHLIAKHDRRVGQGVLFTEVRPLRAPGPERIALERCGYEFLDYLNFVTDLSPATDQLWSSLRKSARSAVRKCERRGFQVRDVRSRDAVRLLYRFLKISYNRSQVPLADKSLFDAAFRKLAPHGMLKVFVTYDGKRPVAADSLLLYKDDAIAWYGGLERMRGVSPFDYLQWQELVWAKEQQFSRYDFGGAGWPDEPYGVRDFKAKFGGKLVCYGRYRKVHAPWKLAVSKRAYEIGRSIISPK